MKHGDLGRRARLAIFGVLGCGLLAGCGAAGTPGFESEHDNAISLSSLGNLVAFNKLFPNSAPLPQTDAPVACPTIEVQDGTASVRVFAGEETNDHVRYAFAMGDIARDCSKSGNQITLRVGAEGRVLLGPAGSPGAFTVPIRVAVRDDNTQKILVSQLVRVPASIASGETSTAFTYVSDPISVPFVPHPDEDYVILVGFDPKGQGVPPGANPRKRRHKG